jgi:hypothetical protein
MTTTPRHLATLAGLLLLASCDDSPVGPEEITALQLQINDLATAQAATDATVSALLTDVETLQTDVEALEAANAVLEADYAALQSTVADLTSYIVVDTDQDAVHFVGANVYVQSGAGATDATVTGLGNLIVGYNEAGVAGRAGSHNLIVGMEHSYDSYGGVVFGTKNYVMSAGGSVLGGTRSEATGENAVVLGGNGNTAAGRESTVLGEDGNYEGDLQGISPTSW